MKTLNDLFIEAITPDTEMEKMVIDSWNGIFKNTKIYAPKSGIGTANYHIFIALLGKDKSEWSNGIWQNDPLNLSFSVTDKDDGSFVIAWDRQRLTINPTTPHMAFSGKKLNLRKGKAKDIKDLEKKLKIAFNKVKDSIKGSLKNGEFDVHKDEIVNMIKSKV